jgi:membrane protease YdiL (CAAX protease family)
LNGHPDEVPEVPLPLERPLPRVQRRDLLVGWVKAIAIIAMAKALSTVEPSGMLAANLAGVAAFVFIAVPDAWLRRNDEHWPAFGLPYWGSRDRRTYAAWARGLRDAVALAAVTFPVFFTGFCLWGVALPHLAPEFATFVAPYARPPDPRFRFPDGMAMRVVIQLLVVALPEELFYRGWMQTAWARTEPERTFRFLGARVGVGFIGTQALFALGHLVVLQPWRIATFFPGLVFGWLRARTGNVAAPIFYHAMSNLFIATLEASWYGR